MQLWLDFQHPSLQYFAAHVLLLLGVVQNVMRRDVGDQHVDSFGNAPPGKLRLILYVGEVFLYPVVVRRPENADPLHLHFPVLQESAALFEEPYFFARIHHFLFVAEPFPSSLFVGFLIQAFVVVAPDDYLMSLGEGDGGDEEPEVLKLMLEGTSGEVP